MMINSNQADMLTLDSGMGYMAGEFFTMMPIMAERYSSGEYWVQIDLSDSLHIALSFSGFHQRK